MWRWYLLVIGLICCACSARRIRRQGFAFPDEEVEHNCRTPLDEPGNCIESRRCQKLANIRNYNLLRRYICGFTFDEPKLCCPIPSQVVTEGPRPPTRRPVRPTVRPPVRPPSRPPTTAPPSRRPVPPSQGPDVPSREGGKPSFLPEDCGKTNVTISRIVGGREAEVGAWPWMAAIYISSGGVSTAACGGALVSNRHVITAAHCVVTGRRADNLPPSVFRIRLGDHNLVKEENNLKPVDVGVTSLVRHAKFEPRTFKNDIAIMRLDKDVTFTETIKPVCLPFETLRKRSLEGFNAFVTGWGTTAFNGESSDVLMEAQIRIWDEETCKKAFEKDLPISEVYLCAGDGRGRKDSCQGDSGGPLVLPDDERQNRFNLIGIVSFGKRCATPGYPGVYTRVTNYLDWITANMK